jgi:hypothetical protein
VQLQVTGQIPPYDMLQVKASIEAITEGVQVTI